MRGRPRFGPSWEEFGIGSGVSTLGINSTSESLLVAFEERLFLEEEVVLS